MLQRPHREGHGHHPGPDAHTGPEPAETHGAHSEAFLGDGREQGDGAAEEHGEQVQAHGAEQDGAASDEPQALEGIVDCLSSPRAGQTAHPRRRDEGHDAHHGDQGDGRQQVGERLVGHEGEAEGDRTDDQAALVAHGLEGHHPSHHLRWAEVNGQRPAGRRGEGPAQAEEQDDGEDGCDRGGVGPGVGEQEQ